MVYVITSACVGVKSGDCVDVCPVDAIHPNRKSVKFSDATRLYIDPQTCISCGLCQSVCPAFAAMPEDEATPEDVRENEMYFGVGH